MSAKQIDGLVKIQISYSVSYSEKNRSDQSLLFIDICLLLLNKMPS